jgi:thioester reductase-like protein
MGIFLTGATGYIGGHVLAGLLTGHADPVHVLVRAASLDEARQRLWRSLQLHLKFEPFYEYLRSRLVIHRGELTEPNLGLDEAGWNELAGSIRSIIHCAASLNRKSEKTCLNVNLRGTLEVIRLARQAQDRQGLRRFSHVSTVAVAGQRQNEVVTEDQAIDWARSDYDPYARTKKFCEHMIRQLLPDVPRTIFRPSIVLGDSRRAETTQFDMVRAFVVLAGLPVLPFRPADRIDIVPVEFVADAIVFLHQKAAPRYDTYHLSSGVDSQTFRELTAALASQRRRLRPLFVPALVRPAGAAVELLSHWRGSAVGHAATLLKVFRPYLTWNTVFDNSRVTQELGRKPAPFSQYSYPLLRFSTENHFQFRYQPWPELAGGLAR